MPSCFKNLRASYPNNIVIGHLNINSLRNKFEILSTLIADTFDIFILSETKLDNTFTSAKDLFHKDLTVMIKVVGLCFV